ncbi:M48 family metallopeptidase [Imbroritus primus]|uniref:M48 family metallopeptidase n=2 Tax=Imbroritus primus TaxID=3058603 RepID=A0ACD3SKZ4_9BURK|nr:M48 family metallopeptidase [Burkholderiaceae bacterium PBA]
MPRRPLATALLMVLCTTSHAQGAPLPMSEDAARAADRVQGNLERSVRAGQVSEFGLRNSTVIEPGNQLPDLGDPSTASLSPDMERRLGDRIMRQIRRDPAYMSDPLLADYLNEIGYRLIEAARKQHVAGSGGGGSFASGFEIFGVRDRSINAFALPGGYIGVHSGLLTAADTESELAAVLGHEIGHVTQRHIARGIGKSEQSMWIALGSLLLAGLAASASPDAAQALALGGQAAAVQNQLSFSRDAEREADRVGFQIMLAAGFDPQGTADFFRRMQRATSISESSVPSYVRTHPVTTERIADMENRIRGLNSRRQPTPSEFMFAKARARVLQETAPNGQASVRDSMRTALQGARPEQVAGLWYGIAVAEQQLGRYDAAEAALQEARRAYGNLPAQTSGSLSLDLLAIELMRARGRMDEALTQSAAVVKVYPLSRAAAVTYGETLLGAQRLDRAVTFLRGKTRDDRSQAIWWNLLARAYAAQGKRVQQHQALAERYALEGSLNEAVQQLRIARQAGDGDFYLLSEVDARLTQLERQFREEQRDNKALPN